MERMTDHRARGQKAGGLSALYMALAYLGAMPFFLIVVDYQNAAGAAAKLALVVGNYASMYAVYIATYLVFGIALGILALALYDRLRGAAPATARVAAFVGLLWSFALVASGMVYTFGMTTVVALAEAEPAGAPLAWQMVETVAMGLGGAGGEFLGGLWVLLISVLALRSGLLPKALNWLGLAVGLVGLASVTPPLHDAAYAFGMLQILWFIWVGVALIRTKVTPAEVSG